MKYTDLDKGKKLQHLWWDFQVFMSLWWLWLGILIGLAAIFFVAAGITNLLSHPESIGSWFGKLVAGFNQANP